MISTVKTRAKKNSSNSTSNEVAKSRNSGAAPAGNAPLPRAKTGVRSRLTSESPASRTEASGESEAARDLKRRVLFLHDLTIDFVANRDFNQLPAPESWEIGAAGDWRRLLGQQDAPTALDQETDVSRLCETHLLTADEEVRLFRYMNQLKFGAVILRERLRPNRPNRGLVERIEWMLDQAQQIRNHVVQANVRLVVAIVKRLTGPQHDFDEFVSDGMLSLMQVVEKFDFDRGFRFSTYAYRALTRTVFRKMASVHKQEQRAGNGMDDTLLEVPGRLDSTYSEGTWKSLKMLLCEFMQHLDRRERHIIYARYALGFESKGATFQALADELGVSKERVRQLERRAMDKLQALAAGVDLDQFVEASRV